jgi:predicted transcriptional regulator
MKGLRFRPEQVGLRTSLFDLEAEIMEVVWSQGWDGFTVNDVHEHLEAQREIAYTTVMTTLSRLFDKELLERAKDGRRYVYRARMNRTEFIETMTRDVLNSLPPVGQQTAVALLVERVADADEKELAHLEALIRQRREGSNA